MIKSWICFRSEILSAAKKITLPRLFFYLDTNLKFSPKCELSYFCFFSDLYTRILLEQANKIYGRWFLNSAHRNIVLEYHSFSLFPHKHRRRFKIILWKSKFLKIVIKLIWLNCCVFRPAHGCSARCSLRNQFLTVFGMKTKEEDCTAPKC